MCSKLQHKTLNSMVVGARQNFQILRQIPGFSKTIELCLIFYTWFLISQSIKKEF